MPSNATVQPSQGGLANATNQPRHPLRRAIYIHVSDLTSAYNIDNVRLEEELARVKKDRDNPAEPSTNARLGVPTELDTFSQKRLQPPRGGYNLCVLIGNVNVVVDKGRVDGSRVRLAEVEVGDETGTVSLRARDEQIDTLREVSERSGAVVLRNCTLELYQGKHIRLAITKWGKISTYPDQVASTPPPPSKINQERNFSLIDLSLVASEMAIYPQTSQYGSQSSGESGTTGAGNRMPSYQSGPTMARRGGGGGGRRPSPRGKPTVQSSVMPQQYSEPNNFPAMRYQGGMHSYPGGYAESQPYSYPQRQQQQMMMHQHQHQHQQQYEMQRQMQQHQAMYATQDRQRPAPGASPMLVPIVSAVPSFESSFGGSELPVPLVGSNQMLMPIGGQQQPQQQKQQDEHSPPSRHSSGAESPMSPGKMNPQAATFDPQTKKPDAK